MERRNPVRSVRSHGLIIEDDENLLEIYLFYLGRFGLSADVAKTLEEARSHIENGDHGFILLDGQFPERQGMNPEAMYHEILQICNERMKEKHHRAVIFHITGSCDPDKAGYALENGLYDCLVVKPLMDYPTLMKLIRGYATDALTYGKRTTDHIPLNPAPGSGVVELHKDNCLTAITQQPDYLEERRPSAFRSKYFYFSKYFVNARLRTA